MFDFKKEDENESNRSERDLTNAEINEALRKKRQDENKAWSLIKKTLIYFVYLSLLFNVCYSKTDSRSYAYQTQLKNNFLREISIVQTSKDVWMWVNQHSINSLMGTYWYNSGATGLKKYTLDYSSVVVGTVLMRQSRIKTSTSQKNLNIVFKYLI